MTGGPLNNEEDGYDSPFPRVVVAAPSDTDRDFKRIPAETRAELIHMAEGRIKDVWADSPEGVDAATLASNVVAAQEFVWMQLAAGVDLRASQPVQVEVTETIVCEECGVTFIAPRGAEIEHTGDRLHRLRVRAALGGGE